MQLTGCFDCNSPGHWAENCDEALLPPAANHAEHMARIDRYVGWCFEENRITPHQKRKLIEQENARWRKNAPGRKTA